MANEKLKVEYASLDSLKEYKMNCKLHPQEQIEQIKRSIEEFGFNDPIAVWHGNEIIEGHGRLLAAQELGLDVVPIIHLDHLTDEERRAYMLVHNQLTMNSDFDLELLDFELDAIEDIDMEQFGFDGGIDIGDFGEDFTLPDGEKSEFVTMTFSLHENQRDLIKSAMDMVKDNVAETFGNTNSNGNALYEVVRQWAELKK